MTPDQHRAAARDLFEAERTGVQIGLLSRRYPDMTLDDAYAVQAALIDMKREAGRTVLGWKIGLTSRAMQDALKIDTPDSGVLLDDMLFETGSTVPAGRFIQPRVEAEIAFLTKAPLSGPVTPAQVLEATECVAPSLEILDTRILRSEGGQARIITDTVSDNAANAGIVLGAERHAPLTDLRWTGAIVSRDGTVEETGLGAGVLGDPALSVAWLSERLGRYGMEIEAGQWVLSGSFIRPVECPPGARIEADFGGFGRVEIEFA